MQPAQPPQGPVCCGRSLARDVRVRHRSKRGPQQSHRPAPNLPTPPPSGPSRGHFGIADLGVPGLWVPLAYAPKVPRLPWRKRSRPFGRGSALQTRFCLCTQYCCNTRWKCPQHLLSVLCPNTHVWNLRTTYGPACSHSKLLHAVFCDRGAACMPETLSLQ